MRAAVLVMLVGCAAAPVDHGALDWSAGTTVDGVLGNSSFECGDEVAHPCPWLTFMGKLTIVGTTATWSEPSMPFTEPLPIVETVVVNTDGSFSFPERSDEAGLRMAATIYATGGDFTWLLDTVAGETTFHVERTP
jgi:hypothetical protein